MALGRPSHAQFPIEAARERSATGYDENFFEVKALPLSVLHAIAAVTTVVLLVALMAYLNVEERSDPRNFASGHQWTNPVSRASRSSTRLGFNPANK